MKELSWGVWFVRWIITLASTAVLTASVAFWISDYVVKAHTASSNEAMRSLQASIETLNGSVLASTAATDRLEGQMSELLRRSTQHSEGIASLQLNVSRIASAVQDAGIDIRIGAKPGDSKVLSLTDLRAFVGPTDATVPEDLYIRVPGWWSKIPVE